jgi:hypothetical protein
VDDILVIGKHGINDHQICLNRINNLRTMKFTSEMESNDSLSFLDVLVGENGLALFTTEYTKPTNIGRYLHYEQNHPSYVKWGGGGGGVG